MNTSLAIVATAPWISQTNPCVTGKRGFETPQDLWEARKTEGKPQPVAYFTCRKCGQVHLDKDQRVDISVHLKFYIPDELKNEGELLNSFFTSGHNPIQQLKAIEAIAVYLGTPFVPTAEQSIANAIYSGDTIDQVIVRQETLSTLPPPETMTDDELANGVIQMFGKMREYLPYIVALKERFISGERDARNQLKTPIKGCRTWKEFCTSILQRTPQTVWEAIREKKLKQLGTTDVTTYELENPGIRDMAKKFLKTMPPEDVVGALIGQDVPEPIAEAIVRSETQGHKTALPSPASFPVADLIAAVTNLRAELTTFRKSKIEKEKDSFPTLIRALRDLAKDAAETAERMKQ